MNPRKRSELTIRDHRDRLYTKMFRDYPILYRNTFDADPPVIRDAARFSKLFARDPVSKEEAALPVCDEPAVIATKRRNYWRSHIVTALGEYATAALVGFFSFGPLGAAGMVVATIVLTLFVSHWVKNGVVRWSQMNESEDRLRWIANVLCGAAAALLVPFVLARVGVGAVALSAVYTTPVALVLLVGASGAFAALHWLVGAFRRLEDAIQEEMSSIKELTRREENREIMSGKLPQEISGHTNGKRQTVVTALVAAMCVVAGPFASVSEAQSLTIMLDISSTVDTPARAKVWSDIAETLPEIVENADFERIAVVLFGVERGDAWARGQVVAVPALHEGSEFSIIIPGARNEAQRERRKEIRSRMEPLLELLRKGECCVGRGCTDQSSALLRAVSVRKRDLTVIVSDGLDSCEERPGRRQFPRPKGHVIYVVLPTSNEIDATSIVETASELKSAVPALETRYPSEMDDSGWAERRE